MKQNAWKVPVAACILVILCTIMFAAKAVVAHSNATAELEEELAQLEVLKYSLDQNDRMRTVFSEQAAPALDYSLQWEPHRGYYEHISPVLPELQALADRHYVVASNRSTPNPIAYGPSGSKQMVREVNIRIIGEFSRVFAWLADVEATLPFARVDYTEFRPAGASALSLRLKLIFPSFIPADEESGQARSGKPTPPPFARNKQ